MSYSGSGNNGGGWGNGAPDDAHAFDPNSEPELFRGVLTRRVVAFLRKKRGIHEARRARECCKIEVILRS